MATLARDLGDLDLAEDATQDALTEALTAWARVGIPDRPGAWLTTVARRRAIDRLRRNAMRADREVLMTRLEERAQADEPGSGDDQLAPPRRARTVRLRDGHRLVTDGPFAETKEAVGGFDLIEAASLDEAVEIAAGHPVAAFGTIEVRPLWGQGPEPSPGG